MKASEITRIVLCLTIVAGVIGVVNWALTKEARDFQVEFNAPLPRSAAERDALRPRVVAKLTELSNGHLLAKGEYYRIQEGVRDLEGVTTPQAVMAQADLRRKLSSAGDKSASAYRRFHDACYTAFPTYYEEVDTLHCGPGGGFPF